MESGGAGSDRWSNSRQENILVTEMVILFLDICARQQQPLCSFWLNYIWLWYENIDIVYHHNIIFTPTNACNVRKKLAHWKSCRFHLFVFDSSEFFALNSLSKSSSDRGSHVLGSHGCKGSISTSLNCLKNSVRLFFCRKNEK